MTNYINDINDFIGQPLSEDFIVLMASIVEGWKITPEEYDDNCEEIILEALGEAQSAMCE